MLVDVLEHLKALCSLPGLPGYEAPVADLLRAAWGPLVHAIHVDRLGSLWAIRHAASADGLAPASRAPNGQRRARGRAAAPPPAPRIMLAAHMDAIGLIVTRLEGDFLRVTSLGGIDVRALPGQIVTVYGTAAGERQALPAVVAAPPAHLLPRHQREGATPVAEVVVDTGLPAERLREIVRPGDLVAFAQPPHELLNGCLAARSLDNRASLAALTVCLEALQERGHAWEVVAVATVQEEIGMRGARPAAFAVEPALAVAVDVTFGSDSTTREFAHLTRKLESGPALALGPNMHPGLHAAFKAAAERAEIPYTVEPIWSGNSSTDAFGLQVARAGVPTMLVSIPLRNMHTPVEVVALKDISRTGRLLAEFIAGLPADFLATLGWD